MVERSEFHINEGCLVARAEINQTSVAKKEELLAIWTQVCPMEHNGRKCTLTPIGWKYELAGSKVVTALTFLFLEFMASHFGFSFRDFSFFASLGT